MTTTNYLSPQDFKKMVDAIPLVTEYNISRLHTFQGDKVPRASDIQAILWIQYCHALRISEALLLTRSNFNFQRKILTLTKTKTGFKKVDGKKVRKNQFTSIPPDFPLWIETIIQNTYKDDERLFNHSRQLIWSYIKKASKFAGLELGEQQDERYIEGAWTHLLRKSRAKMMIELGASEVMVKVKLRHTFTIKARFTGKSIRPFIWKSTRI